jgi:hypothetical protein
MPGAYGWAFVLGTGGGRANGHDGASAHRSG